MPVVNTLLSVTFACGVVIAGLHVLNRKFVAPVYDVVLNLTAFVAAVASSTLLGHWLPALLSALAVVAWIGLGWRTLRARHLGHPLAGQVKASERDGVAGAQAESRLENMTRSSPSLQ